MALRNIAAIHDRIDEEHFELRLQSSAIDALQRRVVILEARVRELSAEGFTLNGTDLLRRNRNA